MRKIISLILALALFLSLACAHAEESSFPASDWTLVYTAGGIRIAEQTVFIYEDNTFEAMDEDEKIAGTWTYDGETLELTAGTETLTLKWNEEAREFTGEYNGAAITMTLSVEPESAPSLAGGWAVPEDHTLTEEISTLFWTAMDAYQTGTITVSYVPVVLLGTQVVAGTNYAVLCREQEINNPVNWAIVYMYSDREGNVSVTDIAKLPLGQ